MSFRMERIAEQLRAELARLLREEVSDPRIGLVSLTRVEVARDLATAQVFWSQLDPRTDPVRTEHARTDGLEPPAEEAKRKSPKRGDRRGPRRGSRSFELEEALRPIADGLESASGFLRRRLAQELALRRTPALRFRHDPSIRVGSDTLALISGLEIAPLPTEASAESPGTPLVKPFAKPRAYPKQES